MRFVSSPFDLASLGQSHSGLQRWHGSSILGPVVGLVLTACATGAAPPPDDPQATDASVDAAVKVDGGVSLTQACADNATQYCAQYNTCFPTGMHYAYGDVTKCAAVVTTGCTFAVSVPDKGWTGDALEACVKGRSAMTCSDFLHGKNYPAVCYPKGARADATNCLYGSQCQSGYCKIASGQTCGTCVPFAAQGAACNATADCKPGLLCANNATCAAPATQGAVCDDAHPCSQELYCDKTAMKCQKPGGPGTPCSPTLASADCDYFQLSYCDGMSCKTYGLAEDGQACGSIMNQPYTLCASGEGCLSGVCTMGGDVGTLCDPSKGLNCLGTSSCTAGVCTAPKYNCK